MIVNSAFADTDVLGINCDAKTVKKNGVDINYYGKFPKFIIGDNALVLTFSQILAEQNGAASSVPNNVYDANWAAQSFRVKHTDSTYRSIKLMLGKEGSPPANLTVTIEGDDAGKPDGSAIATFTITAASLTQSINFITADNASNFSLTGNTKYWIVLKTTGGDNSNKYYVYSEDSDTYANGNFATSPDSGANWTDDYTTDLVFYLYFGGKGSAYSIATIINYYPRYL
jgi:hypothetical protein